jgi:hypothetical protein
MLDIKTDTDGFKNTHRLKYSGGGRLKYSSTTKR